MTVHPGDDNAAEWLLSRYSRRDCPLFSEKAVPSQQETLGQIVVEILRDGKTLNRKMLCTKLLGRLEKAHDAEQENHYHQLLGMLFER
ncbi:two-component-system connector protein YcgZ [Pluralibacter gergoviae]|nr:two-component-system connector protein YcgZ [Pluralibacter gergoviae]